MPSAKNIIVELQNLHLNQDCRYYAFSLEVKKYLHLILNQFISNVFFLDAAKQWSKVSYDENDCKRHTCNIF